MSETITAFLKYDGVDELKLSRLNLALRKIVTDRTGVDPGPMDALNLGDRYEPEDLDKAIELVDLLWTPGASESTC